MRVRLYTECLADVGLAEILFAGEDVQIIDGGDSSGAISTATFALMRRPREPVALLAGTREAVSADAKDAQRASTHSLVLRAGTMNYFVAFAEVRPLDWVLTDAKLRRAYEASPQDMKIYLDRSRRVVELARSIPFDRSTLLEQSEDYRGLLAFIRKHASAVPATPSRAG